MTARRTPRRAEGFVLTVVAALALTGCFGGTSEPEEKPQATATQIVLVAEPLVGQCRRLDLAGASATSDPSTTVDCTSPHTAQTVHVAVARSGVTPAKVCPARLRTYLGGPAESFRLSRFTTVWFVPTQQEADLGARWFRCDAILFGRDDQPLPLPVPARLRGALARPPDLAAYGLCGTARPGDKGFARVACSLPHSWEAMSTIDLPGARYPGAAKARTLGDEPCADQVSRRVGAVLEFDYGWEWPTAQQWTAGQRYGYCWAPTGLL